MDPIANFMQQMEKEDRAVDHLQSKMNEGRVEKLQDQVKKLSEYIVDSTGCEPKEVEEYKHPGIRRPPLNKRRGEEKQKRIEAEQSSKAWEEQALGWCSRSKALVLSIQFLENELPDEKSDNEDWLAKYQERTKDYFDRYKVPEEYR